MVPGKTTLLTGSIVNTTTYLFVVQKAVSRGEAYMVVGFELRGFAVEVELETGSSHYGL